MADNLQSNVITVDEQGRVGADFAGHISAAGVDLATSKVEGGSEDSRLRWLRREKDGGDGSVSAQVFSSDGSPPSSLGGDRGTLLAYAYGAGFTAGLQLVAADPSHGDTAAAYVLAGTFGRTILNQDAESHFVQLISRARRAIDTGAGELSFVNQSSRTATVAHGLGRVPKIVVPVVAEPSDFIAQTYSKTATHFEIRIRQMDALNKTADVDYEWLAFG